MFCGRSFTTVTCNSTSYRLPTTGNPPMIGVCLDGTSPAHLKGCCMPNFWSGSYREVQAVLPSLTNPNNMSIVTGVLPKEHGIGANTILRKCAERGVFREELLSRENDVLCDSLLSAASRAGLSVLVITAKNKLLRLLGRGLSKECLVVAVEDLADSGSESRRALEKKHLDDCMLECGPIPSIYSPEASVYCLQLGVEILRQGPILGFSPSLVYLSTTDYVQHLYAPDSNISRNFYEAIDRELGALSAIGKVGVTADHGMNLKPVIYFLEDLLNEKGWAAQVGLAIKDPHMIHHLGLGSFVTVHLDNSEDQRRVQRFLENLPGVDSCSSRKQGVLELYGDHRTAFGRTKSFHLSAPGRPTNAPIRSHGGPAECPIPMAFLFSLSPARLKQFLQNPGIQNKDLFYYLCEGVPLASPRCALL